MEWSNEVIVEFLDLYESEPVIWNPLNQHHKDRSQIYDAWKRIQSKLSIECSLKELKKKKENLMATYRKLAMKVIMSARTGTEFYRPEWFAYEKMASFLHTVYTPRGTKNTERPDYELYNNDDDLPAAESEDPVEPPKVSPAPTDEKSHDTAAPPTPAVNQSGPPLRKKRKVDQPGLIEKRMDEAYLYLKQVAAKSKVVKDESYLFCELLCWKLRALDHDAREVAMHEINNLMFNFKNSRTQQPNILHNYSQPHGFVESFDQHQSPVYGSRESTASCNSPAQMSSSSPPHNLNDIKIEVDCCEAVPDL